ncbi:hypothetical protein LT493_44935 [Streptomyces tricolor]|nr:hypothetical protein [Streptomyces tricolor]
MWAPTPGRPGARHARRPPPRAGPLLIASEPWALRPCSSPFRRRLRRPPVAAVHRPVPGTAPAGVVHDAAESARGCPPWSARTLPGDFNGLRTAVTEGIEARRPADRGGPLHGLRRPGRGLPGRRDLRARRRAVRPAAGARASSGPPGPARAGAGRPPRASGTCGATRCCARWSGRAVRRCC